MTTTSEPLAPVTADDIVDAFWLLAEAAANDQWHNRHFQFSEPDHRWWLSVEGQDDGDLADSGAVPVDPRGVLATIGITNPHLGLILTQGYGRLIERHRQEHLEAAEGARMLADAMEAGGFATLGDLMAARRTEQQASHPKPSA